MYNDVNNSAINHRHRWMQVTKKKQKLLLLKKMRIRTRCYFFRLFNRVKKIEKYFLQRHTTRCHFFRKANQISYFELNGRKALRGDRSNVFSSDYRDFLPHHLWIRRPQMGGIVGRKTASFCIGREREHFIFI